MKKEQQLEFEYKGYKGHAELRASTRYYYGYIINPKTSKPFSSWAFAGNNAMKVQREFESQVDKMICYQQYKRDEKRWRRHTDVLSIEAVFNMSPRVFLENIETNRFDRRLIEKVTGGFYEVPLPYVTKAWDYFLNNDLGAINYFWANYYDGTLDSEEIEDIFGTTCFRSCANAIKDNNAIKEIWKDRFGIDIDQLDVDFEKFDRHLPPHSKDGIVYDDYFNAVPNGLSEWILVGVGCPNIRCQHDKVSDLMEFVAYIKYMIKNNMVG